MQIAAQKGRRRWLQKFLMQKLPVLDNPEADYKAWFDHFIQLMNNRGLVEPIQQKDYLTDVRNAIKVLNPEHPALSVVKFNRDTWIEISNHYSDRIAERKTKFLDDPDAIVQQAIILLGSCNWSEIAAGLAVVTGRRCTEIIKTARFEYKTKYSLMFAGSLKRRGELVECVFEIPTLCEAESVISAIALLRKKLGGEINKLSKRQINSRFGKAVSTQCDRYFSELVPTRNNRDNLYTHLFRAVYATIASYWYCPATVPEIEYRAAIQGHYQILDAENPELRRSIAAGRNYFDYKISDGKGNVDGRLGIKLNEPEVEVVEQFKSYIPPPNLIPSSKLQQSETKSTVTTLQLSKPSRRQDKNQLIMNQTNFTSETAIVIPSFLHSRLSAISDRLDLSSTETIEELFKWTEVGISLASELGLQEANPSAVFDSVQLIKQTLAENRNKQAEFKPNDSAELIAAQRQITSLTDSLLSMSRAIEELALGNRNHKAEPVSANSYTTKMKEIENRPQKSSSTMVEGKMVADRKSTDSNKNIIEEHNKVSTKSQTSSTATRKRDSSDTVRKDINHAIDAIIEFNNAPNRPQNHKFYIGVGSLKELTNRGDVAIRKLLEERGEEIQKHLDEHQIDQNQNLSRRDDEGNDYPKIAEEEGINYNKITQVA